jgi:DNA-binding transcriptional LysR family regulator
MKSALMPDALRSNRIELGFACGPLEPGDLVERVVVRERMLVAVSRENALAARARLKLRDLEGQPFVLVRPDVEPAWAGACAAALRSQGLDYVVAQETDSKLAMLGLVAANVGVSLVSESMQRLRRAGVKFLPLADFALRLPLVTLARPDPSPRAREFLKLARQRAG